VAVLWASESGIYGRYGYGMGSRHARISANTYEVKLAHPVPPAERRIRLGEASNPKLRADIEAVYDRARPTLVGHCDRRDRWWDFRLHDPERDRSGATPLRAALHDGAAGADGYALFAVRGNWSSNGPDGEVQVHELVAENPEAHAALWAFLFDTDLVTKLSWRIAPADAPLVHLVDDPRRITVSTIDNLWVRVVDVGRALATRRYAAPVDVVVDVTDAFCPWNTGRWRLAGGPDGAVCARTDAAADLALSSTELGAAYLGGTTFAALAAVGRVQELRAGAVRAASTAFAEPRQPYCPEVF
jgi:predicted acetyltransferase